MGAHPISLAFHVCFPLASLVAIASGCDLVPIRAQAAARGIHGGGVDFPSVAFGTCHFAGT
jgi:hypothetical protein